MLVNIGSDVMIPRPLEIDKWQVALQMSRHITTLDDRINLSVHSHLVQQVVLGEQGADLQVISLDVARETRSPRLLRQSAVHVDMTQ